MSAAVPGPFVIELVAHDKQREHRGYLSADGALVPLARPRTFTTEAEASNVAAARVQRVRLAAPPKPGAARDSRGARAPSPDAPGPTAL